MQKLIKCKACGKDVAKSAIICPHCGAKLGLTSRQQMAFVSIIATVALFLAIIFIWGIDPIKSTKSDNTNMTQYDNVVGVCDYATFNKIRTGMSYNQVKKLIGSEGTLMSSTGEGEYNTYSMNWDGYGDYGANVIVIFQNNKVISKSQYGLK